MDRKCINSDKPNRRQQLTMEYFNVIDRHIYDLASGRCTAVMTLKEVAEILFVHPRHLSNVVKDVTGNSTCHHFEFKLVKLAQQMLLKPDLSIKDIALKLDYDPSNFTKFFKKYAGQTPTIFRKNHSI